MAQIKNYRGIIPAISCPFTPDHQIDEKALRRLASWLAGHDGVVAVMTNGHTGEVFSLTQDERAEVTRIVADELKGKMPVISSIVCEGLLDAANHAKAAKAAGAVALDVMPPHHWLRFGCTHGHAIQYFEAIHQAVPDLDLVCPGDRQNKQPSSAWGSPHPFKRASQRALPYFEVLWQGLLHSVLQVQPQRLRG